MFCLSLSCVKYRHCGVFLTPQHPHSKARVSSHTIGDCAGWICAPVNSIRWFRTTWWFIDINVDYWSIFFCESLKGNQLGLLVRSYESLSKLLVTVILTLIFDYFAEHFILSNSQCTMQKTAAWIKKKIYRKLLVLCLLNPFLCTYYERCHWFVGDDNAHSRGNSCFWAPDPQSVAVWPSSSSLLNSETGENPSQTTFTPLNSVLNNISRTSHFTINPDQRAHSPVN